jgi:NADH-quinone oxidoreductase subunit L
VFFTGFYTFRMVYLTFHGEPRTETAKKPHDVRWNVKGPLTALGILATTIGFVNLAPVKKLTGLEVDFLHKWLLGGEGSGWAALSTGYEHYETVLHDGPAHVLVGEPLGATGTLIASALLSLGLAVAGVLFARSLYDVPEPVEHTNKLGSIKTLLMHNYYQDEYQVWLATGFTYPLSLAADKFDQGVIDGVVNGISSVSLFSGSYVRKIQTGVVSNYALFITVALVVLLVVFGLAGGWF